MKREMTNGQGAPELRGPDTDHGVPVIKAKLANADDCLITKKEAAGLLKVTTRTIEEWSKRGYFKTYYLGGSVRYLKSELIGAFVSPIV